MSETATAPTKSSSGSVRVVGMIVAVLGVIFLVAGIFTYAMVSHTLAAENITVSDDAKHFAGSR